MASCLVPDFPAVAVALDRLKELDKELREEGVVFSPQASLHLAEVSAALSELEASRRSTHELLEVETIENSKLRHMILNVREQVAQEIKADVAAARASNSEEMQQLRSELEAVSQLQEALVERREELQGQNQALCPERDEVRAEHEGNIATLNRLIGQKFDLQNHLSKTGEQVEELRSRIMEVEKKKVTAQENLAQEREAFSAAKDVLCREMEDIMKDMAQQTAVNDTRRQELDAAKVKVQDAQAQQGELAGHVAQLESSTARLRASQGRCEKQLMDVRQENRSLDQEGGRLEKELHDLRESFCVSIQRQKEDIGRLEAKMEEETIRRCTCQEALAEISEQFQSRQEEENNLRDEHDSVSRRLERSNSQLDGRVSVIVRRRQDMKRMEEQMRQLLDMDVVRRDHFENNRRELSSQLEAASKSVAVFDEEDERLTLQLEDAKKRQGEHEAKMAADISGLWRRCEQLQREEAELPPGQSTSEEIAGLLVEAEKDLREREMAEQRERRRRSAETEQVVRSSEEKKRELEEAEEALREAEAEFKEEESRRERLRELLEELGSRRDGLDASIRELDESTADLLRPRDGAEAELSAERERHARRLRSQAAELRAAEVGVYKVVVRLEQVGLENSRLRLCNAQMREDVVRAQRDRDRHGEETRRLADGVRDLLGELQAGWVEDARLARQHRSSDEALLDSFSWLLSHLESRKHGLGRAHTLLHATLTEFKKRLRGKMSKAGRGSVRQ